MINVLQINLRKSGPARLLMEQTAQELGSDLLILSEIPRGPPDDQWWVSSADGKAAVAFTRTAMLTATGTSRCPGYAFMQFPDLLVFSCYWRPGCPLHEFERFLSGLDATLRSNATSKMTVIIAGDFNAVTGVRNCNGGQPERSPGSICGGVGTLA